MQCFYDCLVPAVTEGDGAWSFKHEEMHQISGRALKRNQSHKQMRHCSQVSRPLLLSFLAGSFSRSHTFHPALNSSRGIYNSICIIFYKASGEPCGAHIIVHNILAPLKPFPTNLAIFTIIKKGFERILGSVGRLCLRLQTADLLIKLVWRLRRDT